MPENVFVSFNITNPELLAALKITVSKVEASFPSVSSFIVPENEYHITLFTILQPKNTVDIIANLVEEGLKKLGRHQKLTLQWKPHLNIFGPGVLALTPEESDIGINKLRALHDHIKSIIQNAGYKTNARPYYEPHITVMYSRNPCGNLLPYHAKKMGKELALGMEKTENEHYHESVMYSDYSNKFVYRLLSDKFGLFKHEYTLFSEPLPTSYVLWNNKNILTINFNLKVFHSF